MPELKNKKTCPHCNAYEYGGTKAGFKRHLQVCGELNGRAPGPRGSAAEYRAYLQRKLAKKNMVNAANAPEMNIPAVDQHGNAPAILQIPDHPDVLNLLAALLSNALAIH